jgi:hypothetical protein
MTAILEPPAARTTHPVENAPELPVRAAPTPPPVDTWPVLTQPVPAPPAPRRVLSPAGVRAVCVGLILLFAVGVAVQPPADGPQPVAPWWANALNVVIQLGLIAVLAGVLTGRRWTVWAGLATGASLLALSITCPIDGHHVIAAWWFVQMAMGIAMTALPAALLRRTQAASKAG